MVASNDKDPYEFMKEKVDQLTLAELKSLFMGTLLLPSTVGESWRPVLDRYKRMKNNPAFAILAKVEPGLLECTEFSLWYLARMGEFDIRDAPR